MPGIEQGPNRFGEKRSLIKACRSEFVGSRIDHDLINEQVGGVGFDLDFERAGACFCWFEKFVAPHAREIRAFKSSIKVTAMNFGE